MVVEEKKYDENGRVKLVRYLGQKKETEWMEKSLEEYDAAEKEFD